MATHDGQAITSMKRFLTASLITIIVLAQLIKPNSVWAAASLYFSGNGTVTVGQTWSVSVLVSTTQPVNAVDLTVTFPASLVQVTSIDGSGSKFPTDGPGSPAIDNSAGKVEIIRYALGGYTGGAGKVATLVLKAKTAGKATLGFGVSKVIAHDGNGTNVYSGGGSATLIINAPAAQPTPTPHQNQGSSQSVSPTPTQVATNTNPQAAAPAISSSSHPDQNAWYKDKQVKLSWTSSSGQTSGYNVEVNREAASQLAEKITQTQASYETQLTDNGVWYAHVRTQYANAQWSSTSHYKLQLDTQAPGPPAIKINPSTDIKVRPEISFSATDVGSSIAKYQLQLDDGQWQDVTSPYKPKTITTGPHTVTIKAIDQAGNSSQAQLQFTIAPIETPTIVTPNQAILALGSSFKVSGQTSPGFKVEIYINGQLSETVEANDQGKYSGTTDYFRPDQYTISVKAISPDGITSLMSDQKSVAINGLVILGLTLPNWLTYLVLVGVMLLLLAVIIFLILKLRQLKSRPSSPPVHLIEGKLDDLEKALDSSIDQTVANLNPQAAQQIKDQLTLQIDKLEQSMIQPGQPTSKSATDVPSPRSIKLMTTVKAMPSKLKIQLNRFKPTKAKTVSNSPKTVGDLQPAAAPAPTPASGLQPTDDASPAPAPPATGTSTTTSQNSNSATDSTAINNPQSVTASASSPISASPTTLSQNPTPVTSTTASKSPSTSEVGGTTSTSPTPAQSPAPSTPSEAAPAASSLPSPVETPAQAPPLVQAPPPPQPVVVDIATDAFDAVIQAEKQDS